MSIEVGDRFETKDPRDEGKIVVVRQVVRDHVKIQTEVHPKNPNAVGLHRWVVDSGLLKHYRKVSR
jgi:flagellar basal body rod protein FlgC